MHMLRGVIAGFAGLIFLCSITYYNDYVLKQTQLIGDHLPISVFGGLILFLLFLNPLLARVRSRWAFSGRELAIALAIILVGCCIPAGGMMRNFPGVLAFTHQHARTQPGLKEMKILEDAPAKLLMDPSADESRALNGYLQGMAVGQKHISLSDIPWGAWKRTLWYWIPFLFVIWIALVGLSVVVHRQWADHEHLPYPVIAFAKSLLPKEGEVKGRVFDNRLFWIAAGTVLGIHLINYTYEWFPGFIQIARSFDFSPIFNHFEFLRKAGVGYYMNFSIFFAAVAIAYFIPKDISFSLGVAPVLTGVVGAVFMMYGIEPWRGTYGAALLVLPTPHHMVRFGAMVAIAGFFLYNGRHYYKQVFAGAFFSRHNREAGVDTVWGARAFLIFGGIGTLFLISAGLDLPLALLFMFSVFLACLIQARVVAETGFYFFHPDVPVFMLALFGTAAMGPRVIVPIAFVAMVLAQLAGREGSMPYMVNALKLLDIGKIKSRKPVLFFLLALVVAMAVALPLTFYFQYDRGQAAMWGTANGVAHAAIRETKIHKERLIAQGGVEAANNIRGLSRVLHMTPDARSMISFGIGLIGASLLTVARLRIPGWPLHPLVFLMIHIWGVLKLGPSFFLGWIIKSCVAKYGGEKLYQSLKPLMIGLIAGDMVGGILPAIIGFVYHLMTGALPKAFMVTAG